MKESRRKYTVEFKREAVRLTREPGRTLREVAARLGINAGMLHRWRERVNADGDEAFPGGGRVKASDEEVRQLHRELARVKEERDILKKALAYFAKHQS